MTALLLACKYEEVSVPVVDDLILISDKAYTRREVLDMVKISFLPSIINLLTTGVHRKYNTSKFSYAARIKPAGFLL